MSRSSDLFTRMLQKSLLTLFPIRDNVTIFLVHVSTVVLSIRMSDFGRGGAVCLVH